ncbi:hypothetical protein AB0H83_34380 [Dactylosporangium sp. NPDC050688]|uniref:hypothetical protein n=1 Tax=Dactylosporangium sp. NPDC050688 TaxID=3157217 RepID=UPI0033DAEDE0
MASEAKHAKRSRVQGQRLALILVLASAAAASVLVPWLVTSDTDGVAEPSPVTSGPAPSSPVTPSSPAPTTPPPTVGPSTAATSAGPGWPGMPQATSFQPIVVEAEHPGNIWPSGAKAAPCAACSGGHRLKYVSAEGLSIPVNVPAAGTRTVTVAFATDGDRTLVVAVNKSVVFDQDVVGAGWETPRSVTFTAYVPAGAVQISLGSRHATSPPDLDKITIA